MTDWIPVSEAAQRLGVHRDTVVRLADAGSLVQQRYRRWPSSKYDTIRIDAASVDDLIAQRLGQEGW